MTGTAAAAAAAVAAADVDHSVTVITEKGLTRDEISVPDEITQMPTKRAQISGLKTGQKPGKGAKNTHAEHARTHTATTHSHTHTHTATFLLSTRTTGVRSSPVC